MAYCQNLVAKGSAFALLVLFTSESLARQKNAVQCPQSAPFVFREGDTLSEVLWYLKSEPVYGKNGWIEKTIQINPQLEEFRNSEVPPGTRVIIPIKVCPLGGGWIIENGELKAPYRHQKSFGKSDIPRNSPPYPTLLATSPQPTPLPVATYGPPAPVSTGTSDQTAPDQRLRDSLKKAIETFELIEQRGKIFLDRIKKGEDFTIN